MMDGGCHHWLDGHELWKTWTGKHQHVNVVRVGHGMATELGLLFHPSLYLFFFLICLWWVMSTWPWTVAPSDFSIHGIIRQKCTDELPFLYTENLPNQDWTDSCQAILYTNYLENPNLEYICIVIWVIYSSSTFFGKVAIFI